MKTLHKLILLLIAVTTSFFAMGQGSNMEFERIRIGDERHIICGLELAPDQSYLAISSIQSFPFYKFDYGNRNVIEQFDVGNWYAGSSVNHSTDGKHILLQQLFYLDYRPNNDREVNFEVIESASGRVVKRFDEYHAVALSPDNHYAVSLTSDEVAFWELSTGNKTKAFKVSKASNGLAVSPDGRFIAVSHLPDESELKKDAYYKKNKKALKAALKYKQQLSIYDATTLERLYTVNSLYDIVFRLEYSPDGQTLFCLHVPHTKVKTGVGSYQTYISTIDGKSGEALRKGFTSLYNYEPDFKLSPDGKFFGVVSRSTKFPELHIYDFATGKLLERFEMSYRLWEKTDGGFNPGDGRMSFAFLPDNKTVVMTNGNHLIYWKLKQ